VQSFEIEGDYIEDLATKQDQHSSWAISYSDMITQLLVFFVVIISASNISSNKMEQIQQQFSKSRDTVTSLAKLQQDVTSMLKRMNLQDSVQLSPSDDGVVMVIKDSLMFNSGEWTLGSESLPKLSQLFSVFKELPKSYRFAIEGHCDDSPINSPTMPSNWHLSAARAISVLKFIEESGIAKERISIRAFGDSQPLVSNRNPDGTPSVENRKANRRVVIRIF
jgi:chemotaxis protein MotB